MKKYLPLVSVLFLFSGFAIASVSSAFAGGVNGIMSAFIESYGYVAPVAIYFILTPSLGKILLDKNFGKRLAVRIVLWFAKIRLLACLWGAVITTVAFGLPFYVNTDLNLWSSTLAALGLVKSAMLHSPVFYALYAALITVAISSKVKGIQDALNRCASGIETFGEYFVYVIPVFMFVIGAYLYSLPQELKSQNVELSGSLSVFGFNVAVNTPTGLVTAYLIGAFVTAVACFIWDIGMLAYTKYRISGFSIRHHLRHYWSKVYPLLWSTSSEALAMPLNLHLMSKYYPNIKPEIRQFILGGESFLNVNGTIICVFVMAGLVSSVLEVKTISFVQLLLSIPVVFVLGYGVPGIPGELVLFAGAMERIIGVPAGLSAAFLALYIGMQIGLPDSFRTGSNSSNNCLYAILIDEKAKKHQQTTLEK